MEEDKISIKIPVLKISHRQIKGKTW